jgi:uncharacterized protein YndB with AHSA1/START domain
MKKGTSAEAHIHVAASPEEVYDLVTDVARMGEWSPECLGGRWLGSGTGAAPGARFKASNRNRWVRWSNRPRVLTAERGREFSFVAPDPLGHDQTKWTYRFEASGEGTRVSESFELVRDLPLYVDLFERYVLGTKDRRSDLEANLRATLGRIKEVVERK